MKSLAALAYGIKAKKGLMLVAGEVGTGKTILLRKLMRDLEATVKFVFVSSSDLSSDGLLPLVAHELGLAKRKSRFEVIQDWRTPVRTNQKREHRRPTNRRRTKSQR